ncbi:MAG: methionine synthase [Nitrospirae bacterium]|nr:MAG: methionine synthase [Nitrospirota bacterium]
MIKPFATTGIGSMPHRNAEEACRLILKTFDIPFWPQLPGISFKEFMIPQFSEGLPCFKTDPEKQSFWIEKKPSDELERFYESCTDNSRIAISEDYARGLHTFVSLCRNSRFPLLKGHITGPLTFTLGLKDDTGRLIYFDEEFREICLMLLKAKIRWQMDMLRTSADRVIIFVDEPILSALGSSSYLGVSAEESLRLLREVTATIKAGGGIPGIHCCGNADWQFVAKSGAEIINFDAYEYAETLALYPDDFRGVLEAGGYLAWGIVPTSDAINSADTVAVRERFDKGFSALSRVIPESLLKERIMLTPSCGTGSRSVEETVKIFQLLMRLKEELA